MTIFAKVDKWELELGEDTVVFFVQKSKHLGVYFNYVVNLWDKITNPKLLFFQPGSIQVEMVIFLSLGVFFKLINQKKTKKLVFFPAVVLTKKKIGST